jgi:hypothetical protein
MFGLFHGQSIHSHIPGPAIISAESRDPMPSGLPFRLQDYLELVGRSYASCVRGISASMHVTGVGALSEKVSAVPLPRISRRFWIA